MELIDYIKIVWKYKWIMLLILVITVSVTGVITFYLPPTYTASAKLQVTLSSSVSIPGYISSSPEKEVNFDTYVELVNDPSFKRDVLNLAAKKDKLGEVDLLKPNTFSLSAQGLPKTNLLVLTAEASHPRSAKVLANAAAQALLEKAAELELGVSKELRKAVTRELQPIDKELAELRTELENLKAQPTASSPVEKSIKMAHIQDEINTAESLRRTYTDFLARLSLNDLLQRGTLQLVYPATAPSYPSSPSLPKNILISLIVGLSLGVGTAILLDYRKGGKHENQTSEAHRQQFSKEQL